MTGSKGWVVVTSHPDSVGASIDLAEFANGAPDNVSQGANTWLGGFGGRPGLIGDLLPAIRASFGNSPLGSLRNLPGSLRTFWRFLDAYELWLETKGHTCQRIDRLSQLTGALVDQYSEPGPEKRWPAVTDTRARVVRALIIQAVYSEDGRRMALGALATRPGPPKETPPDDEAISLIRHLRGQVAAIFRRWTLADQLADEGKDILPLLQQWNGEVPKGTTFSEADAHATFRALVRKSDEPVPSKEALKRMVPGDRDFRAWWPRYASDRPQWGRVKGDLVHWDDCVSGLYPTSTDVSDCALLCLGRSAWNPVTLLSIDLSDWHSSYDDDFAWVFARKARAGGALQYTISGKTQITGVYQVVQRLCERNAPLRDWLSKARPGASGLLSRRSPWLGVSKHDASRVFVADPIVTTTLNSRLSAQISRHNQAEGAAIQIGPMTSSQFRDVAAAVMYRESRYSMWTLMLMLGHSSIATARSYGFRHAARQESHALVSKVVADALDQIGETRKWDPTLTRARIEGVPTTPDAISRLQEYRASRTYSGAICSDPCDPPSSIDPTNPKDGRTPCVQGHLCVARACPRATVLNDSLDDICKVAAEIEWKQLHLGAVRFSVGSEETDLAYLKKTLQQWPSAKVKDAMDAWRNRIDRGEHRPIIFAGQH